MGLGEILKRVDQVKEKENALKAGLLMSMTCNCASYTQRDGRKLIQRDSYIDRYYRGKLKPAFEIADSTTLSLIVRCDLSFKKLRIAVSTP